MPRLCLALALLLAACTTTPPKDHAQQNGLTLLGENAGSCVLQAPSGLAFRKAC